MSVVKPNPGSRAYLLFHGHLQIKLSAVGGLKTGILSKEGSLLYPVWIPDFLTPCSLCRKGKERRSNYKTTPMEASLPWTLRGYSSDCYDISRALSTLCFSDRITQFSIFLNPFHCHHSSGQMSFPSAAALLCPKDSGMYQGRINIRIKITLLSFGPSLQTAEIKLFHFSTISHQAVTGPCPPPAALKSCDLPDLCLPRK